MAGNIAIVRVGQPATANYLRTFGPTGKMQIKGNINTLLEPHAALDNAKN